jgi:hypothetical protein
MAAALKAKGYHYRYVFAKAAWRGRKGHSADAPGGDGVALAGPPEVASRCSELAFNIQFLG